MPKKVKYPQMPEQEPTKEKLLAGDVAIVTGAAHGIGRGIALEFAKEGAKIVVADINDENAKITARQLEQLGAEYLTQHTDISVKEDNERLVKAVLGKFGKIDILVNNAAAFGSKEFFDLSFEEMEVVAKTNIAGTTYLTQLVAKEMINQKTKGRIIFITSIHDEVIRRYPIYSATKAGQAMLVREIAQDLSPYGIRVNGIAPGAIDTDDQHVKNEIPGEITHVPLGQKAGLPRDIARMAVVLTSDHWSRYVTGSIYKVDGGLSDVNWLTFEIPLEKPLIPSKPERA